jgi:four helix bundle protein
MQSHFRNLTVYRAALRVAAALFDLTQRTRYEARPVVRQLMRAATSVVLNIAEGAGEYRALEKARIYRIARRSSWEVSAALDILVLMNVVAKTSAEGLQAELNGIGAMLTSMSKNFQKGAEEGTWDAKDSKKTGRPRQKAAAQAGRGIQRIARRAANGTTEAANADAPGNQEAANVDTSGNREAAREP